MPSAPITPSLDLDAIVFSPLAGEALVPQTARRLREAIACGLLAPGQRLPTEPVLSDRLNISPVTLREALAIMRQDGLLVTRRGRGGGTFVAEEIHSSAYAYAALSEAEGEQVRDLADYRRALVSQAAAVVATETELSATVVEVEKAGDDVLPASAHIAEEMIAITRASGSRRLWVEQVEVEMRLAGHFLARGVDNEDAAGVARRIRDLRRRLPTMDAAAARREAAEVADAASALLLEGQRVAE